MKIFTKILMITFILIYAATPAFAHKMMIKPIEDGIIAVTYADGTHSNLIKVTVYDSNDEVILEGSLDHDGYFYYDSASDATRIVAEDGMGHRVTWQVGDPTSYSGDKYKWIKVATIVLFFMGIGFVFYKRNNNKNSAKG